MGFRLWPGHLKVQILSTEGHHRGSGDGAGFAGRRPQDDCWYSEVAPEEV